MSDFGKLGEAHVEVRAGTSSLDRDLSKLKQDLGRRMTSLGDNMTRVGGTLTTRMTLPLVAMGAVAATTFADFERGMNKVAAISGATGTQFERLTQQAMKLGAETQYTARQASEAMSYLAMAGFTVNEIYDAMPGVLQLAASAQLDMGTAASITANVLRGYGLEVSDLERVNNVLVKSFTSANTNLTDLGIAFKYAGPVAKSSGMRFEETASVLANLANMGFQASMGGTALRGALVRLLNPSKENAKLIKELGINVLDSNGKISSFADIIEQLEPHIERTGDLMQLFGQRAGPAMVGLVEMGHMAVRQLTADIDNAGSIAERVGKVQMQGLKGKWIELESAAEGFGIALGRVLSPALQAIMQPLTDMFRKLQNEGIPAFKELPKGVQLGALALAGLAIAAGPALLVLGTLIKVSGLAVIGYSALTGAMFTLGNTVTVLTARLWLMDVAVKATTLSTAIFGPAMKVLNGASIALSGALTGLAARFTALTIVQNISMGTTMALQAAKLRLAAVTLALGLNISALATRFGIAAGSSGILSGALAGLRVALSLAATAALAVGAAFAGWKIGEWIGEVTGLTDWVGKKLAGALYGVTEAEYAASRAAAKATDEFDAQAAAAETAEQRIKRLKEAALGLSEAKDIDALTQVLKELKAEGKLTSDVMVRVAKNAKTLQDAGAKLTPELAAIVKEFYKVEGGASGAGGAVSDFTEQVNELYMKLSGQELFSEANAWLAVLKKVKDVSKLTREEQEEMSDVLQRAIDKYKAMGIAAPKALRETLAETQKLLNAYKDVPIGLGVPGMMPLPFTPRDIEQNQWFFNPTEGQKSAADQKRQQAAYAAMLNRSMMTGAGALNPGLMFSPKQLSDFGFFAQHNGGQAAQDAWKESQRVQQMFSMPMLSGLGAIAPGLMFNADTLNAARRHAEEQADGFREAFKQVGKDLPGMIYGAFTGGGSIIGSLASGFASKFTSVFQDKISELTAPGGKGLSALGGQMAAVGGIGVGLGAFMGGFGIGAESGRAKGMLGGAAGGAMAGAAFGSVVPGIGTAIGAVGGGIIGALGGLFGGNKKNKEDQKAIADARKEIIASFGSVEALKKAADAAGVSVSRMLSTKNPQEFEREVTKLNEALEKKKKIWDGIALAIEGVNQRAEAFAAPLQKAFDELEALKEQRASLLEDGEDTGKIDEKIENLKTKFKTLGDAAQPEFERIGTYATAAFGAAVVESGSLLTAFQMLEPTLLMLSDGVKNFGLEASPAIEKLIGMRDIVVTNKEIFDSLDANTKMLKGFGDAGVMTSDLFQTIGADIGDQYNKLIAKNVDANKAMALMQPTLQQLWEGQQKFGMVTDESTAALLKQAEEAGIVGAHQKSAMDKVLDVLLAIGDALGAKIPEALRGMSSAGAAAVTDLKDRFGEFQSDMDTQLLPHVKDRMRTMFDDMGPAADRAAIAANAALRGIRAPAIDVPLRWRSEGGRVEFDGMDGGFSLPAFAKGGIVTSTMLAQVGEVPEAIIPLSRLEAMLDLESVAGASAQVQSEVRKLRTEMRQFTSTLPAALRDALASLAR